MEGIISAALVMSKEDRVNIILEMLNLLEILGHCD